MGIMNGDTSAAVGELWENYQAGYYQDTSRFSFTVHHGSVLEQAWYSEAHTQYLDQFYQENAPMDLVFFSVPNWTTGTWIPSRSMRLQRTVPRELYRQRNLVERFFCKLKQFRRIATRFDKHAANFLAAIALASARIWMRAIESAA